MTHIQVIAGILLAIRVVAVVYLLRVFRQQWRLIRETVTPFPAIRRILISIVVVSLLSNILPMTIDLAVLLDKSYAGDLLVPYAFSNAIGMAFLAIGWRYMYRIIEREREALERELSKLRSNIKSLKKEKGK